MKKKYLLLICFLSLSFLVSGQEFCGFDEYHEAVIERYGNEMNKYNTQFQEFTKSSEGIAAKNSYTTITIPVVFHVVHNGEPVGQGANVSGGKIYEQLEILNRDFSTTAFGTKAGYGTPTNPKVQFCIAKTDPYGQPTTGITRTYGQNYYTINTIDPRSDDRLIKSINWNPNLYLNVYITDIRSVNNISDVYEFAGYSSFPVVPDYNQGSSPEEQDILRQLIDGIVLNHRFIGKQEGRPLDTDGHVLTHEAGHWIGLFHVFNEIECDFSQIRVPDCLRYGDKICDTPILGIPSLGNTLYPDELVIDCLGHNASAENFMDYNTSLDFFTEEQVDMMHQKVAFYRSIIYNETYLNPDCTMKIDDYANGGGSGGGDEESGSCNGNQTDNYSFKIKSDIQDVGFGKLLSLDHNKLVVSNPGSQKLNFFTVDECSVSYDGDLNMTNSIVKNLLLKDNLLFVVINRSILIFQKSENQSWTQIQQINGVDNEFGINLDYRGNTLVITSNRKLYVYEHNGNNFSLSGSFLVSAQDYIDLNALQFNGEIIAVQIGDNFSSNYVYFYAKNSLGDFTPIYSSEHVIAETMVLTGAPENLLYTYRFVPLANDQNFRVTTYDLSSLAQGGNVIVKANEAPDYWLIAGGGNATRPSNLHVYNDYLLMLSNSGTSFHKRYTANYDLVNVYDGNYNSYLQPSPYAASTSLSKSSDLSGNFLVVGNSYCSEIYIYAISDFLDYSNSDIDVCASPTTDYIEGKTISVGGNSCNLDIDERLDLRAEETITIRPNTHIKNGAVFSAKTINGSNCSLNGGMLLDVGSSSKSSSVVDKTFIHDPIQIKVKAKISKDIEVNADMFSENGDITIYPNPTKGVLGVAASRDNLVVSSTIINLKNAKLLYFDNNNKEVYFELNLSNLPTGIFIINFIMEDGRLVSKRVIKE